MVQSKIKPILLALFGIAAIFIYISLFLHADGLTLLKFTSTRSEIKAKAQQMFEQSVLADQDLEQTNNISIRSELFRYAQLNKDVRAKEQYLSMVRWSFWWRGRFKNDDEEENDKKEQISFSVEYDLNGRLVQRSCDVPGAMTTATLDEPQALEKAKAFLEANAIDTDSLELKGNALTRDSNILTYKFDFERPVRETSDLVDKFSVELTGDIITRYNAYTDLTDPALKQPDFERNLQTAFGISVTLMWGAIIIIFIVVFIKRLRHDELDFKRAKWLGLIMFLAIAGMVVIGAYPDVMGMILGGGLSGLFVGAGALVTFATTESLTRDVSPEKIVLSDLVCRGYFRVREIGVALLQALFIAGGSLLILGAMIYLTENMPFGSLIFDNDTLEGLLSGKDYIVALLGRLVQVYFVATLVLSFWSAYLRLKVKNTVLRMTLLAFSFLMAGMFLNYIRPIHFSFAISIPLAFLWAYFVYKYDIFTILIALVLTYFCVNIAMFGVFPEALSALPGIALVAALVITFGAGVYLMNSRHSATDIEDYVPEYVSRIAERERFLKELEIARRIQLQFLPQQAPNFPNLEISSICKPAMEVGGDYFDFIQDNERYFSVVVGDVSGKGVSAAFYMTMAKGIIKTVAKKIRAPKLLLTEMNNVFFENTPREVFISAIYGLFDMQERTLTFARAGHNPLIMRKTQQGKPEFLNPRGLAIGLDPGVIFAKTIEEIKIKIDPGDVFVFYTDGLSESMDKHGDEFGEERLREIVSKHSKASANELLEIIQTAVNHFAGDVPQHDDFTMVVVKVLGTPASDAARIDFEQAQNA